MNISSEFDRYDKERDEHFRVEQGAIKFWRDSEGNVFQTIDVDFRYESGYVRTEKSFPFTLDADKNRVPVPGVVQISENQARQLKDSR